MRREIIPHRHHPTLTEPMLLVEGTRTRFQLVGQQGDTQEILGPRVAQGMLQEAAAVALPAMVSVDDEILKDQDESSLRSTDGDQQVDHPDDPLAAAKNENTAAVRLLEDQAQAPHLLLLVRDEICLLRKEIKQEIRKLGQIVQSGRFDEKLISHR